MRYLLLGLFLALAACEKAPPQRDVTTEQTVFPIVEPKAVVLIGNCEYYQFPNNHGATYAPKMTPQNPTPGAKYTGGFNKCYPQ